jgi:hypothetical protein
MSNADMDAPLSTSFGSPVGSPAVSPIVSPSETTPPTGTDNELILPDNPDDPINPLR